MLLLTRAMVEKGVLKFLLSLLASPGQPSSSCSSLKSTVEKTQNFTPCFAFKKGWVCPAQISLNSQGNLGLVSHLDWLPDSRTEACILLGEQRHVQNRTRVLMCFFMQVSHAHHVCNSGNCVCELICYLYFSNDTKAWRDYRICDCMCKFHDIRV